MLGFGEEREMRENGDRKSLDSLIIHGPRRTKVFRGAMHYEIRTLPNSGHRAAESRVHLVALQGEDSNSV